MSLFLQELLSDPDTKVPYEMKQKEMEREKDFVEQYTIPGFTVPAEEENELQ